MGCCYIGMKMSVVSVSGAQTWQKIRTGAEDAIFHSPIADNERLELMRPVVDPQPWFTELQDMLHRLK